MGSGGETLKHVGSSSRDVLMGMEHCVVLHDIVQRWDEIPIDEMSRGTALNEYRKRVTVGSFFRWRSCALVSGPSSVVLADSFFGWSAVDVVE